MYRYMCCRSLLLVQIWKIKEKLKQFHCIHLYSVINNYANEAQNWKSLSELLNQQGENWIAKWEGDHMRNVDTCSWKTIILLASARLLTEQVRRVAGKKNRIAILQEKQFQLCNLQSRNSSANSDCNIPFSCYPIGFGNLVHTIHTRELQQCTSQCHLFPLNLHVNHINSFPPYPRAKNPISPTYM